MDVSSKPIIESVPKQDSFDNLWKYNQELRQENSRLKSRLAFMEHEIKLLLPAVFFLRTRDTLRDALAKYSTLAEACRMYRKNPGADRITNILAALRAIESEDKF